MRGAAALVTPASALAQSHTLPLAAIDLRIARDGSVLVRERITFAFSGPFSGAYHDIPLRHGESIDRAMVSQRGSRYRPGGNTKLGSTDAPETFGVEVNGHRVRIVWHYRASDEARTFVISYRFRGLAVVYDDVVDVNFRVWGDHWPAGVGKLTSTMKLPSSTKAATVFAPFAALLLEVTGSIPVRSIIIIALPNHSQGMRSLARPQFISGSSWARMSGSELGQDQRRRSSEPDAARFVEKPGGAVTEYDAPGRRAASVCADVAFDQGAPENGGRCACGES